MIDLTLDSILIPDITGYTPPFGTKVARTAVNKGGLSTQEVNNNIIASFVKMRGVAVTASEETSKVEYDAKIVIEAETAITLTLGNATYRGCRVSVVNATNFTHTLVCTSVSTNEPHILPNANIEIMWNGSAWQNVSGKAVGDIHEQKPQTESPFDIFPCSDWVELISHNGAFYRSANAPTTLYTVDESKWFADSELTHPIEWSGIMVKNETSGEYEAGTVTDTGNTITNSRGETVKIYTGSWTSGKAAAFIDKSGVLIAQDESLPNITGKFQATDLRGGDGCFYQLTEMTDGTHDSDGSFSRYMAFDASRSNPIYGKSNHVTPTNYTIKVWKRTA